MNETENELLNALEDVLAQACLDDEGLFFDSMALSSYADGLHVLAKYGRIEITKEMGRRVIARLKQRGIK